MNEIVNFSHSVHMHEVGARLIREEMVVQRGHVDFVLKQGLHHRVHLFPQEYEVAPALKSPFRSRNLSAA